MSRDASDVMDEAMEGLDDVGFNQWIIGLILSIVTAVAYATMDLILSLGNVAMAPLRALGRGLSRVLEGTFFSATDIIDAGSTAAAESFLTGLAAYLGPAAYPVAVASVVAGLYVLVLGYRRINPLEFISSMSPRR